MNYFKTLVSILTFSFVVGCVPPPQGPNAHSPIQVRDDTRYDDLKERDEDREYVLRDSRKRRSGNVCEDEDRDHECKDMCKEIYGRRGDREDCEELTVSQIEVIFELWEILEEPDEDDLGEIDSEDFDVYLNISISSLDDLVKDWNSREAKEFLYWLINDPDSARVFEKEDDDYDTFSRILKEIRSFNESTETHVPFIQKIEDDKLIEVAIDSGNDEILEWFMDYIEDKNRDCNDNPVSKNCFKVYCTIGEDIDEDYMEDWLSYEVFESYIEDIIDEGVNSDNPTDAGGDSSEAGTGWTYGDDDGEFEDIGDISDDWVEDLCGGL